MAVIEIDVVVSVEAIYIKLYSSIQRRETSFNKLNFICAVNASSNMYLMLIKWYVQACYLRRSFGNIKSSMQGPSCHWRVSVRVNIMCEWKPIKMFTGSFGEIHCCTYNDFMDWKNGILPLCNCAAWVHKVHQKRHFVPFANQSHLVHVHLHPVTKSSCHLHTKQYPYMYWPDLHHTLRGSITNVWFIVSSRVHTKNQLFLHRNYQLQVWFRLD